MAKHKPMPNVKCELDLNNEMRAMPQVKFRLSTREQQIPDTNISTNTYNCFLNCIDSTACHKSIRCDWSKRFPISELFDTSIEHNELLLCVSEELFDEL